MPQLPPVGASGALGAAVEVEEGASGTPVKVVEDEVTTLGGGGPYKTGGPFGCCGGAGTSTAGCGLTPVFGGVFGASAWRGLTPTWYLSSTGAGASSEGTFSVGASSGSAAW